VVNCCYVAICSAAEGASAPTGEERGGGISWRPPAYSLFIMMLLEAGILSFDMHVMTPPLG